jgi:hypothetical protein
MTGPSKEYEKMVEKVRHFHATRKTFSGLGAHQYADLLKDIVARHACTTMLDYGCGKGRQYTEPMSAEYGFMEPTYFLPFIGITSVFKYDPGVPEFSAEPISGWKFDLVMCTDVLEHIPAQDIPWVLDRLFSSASKVVFAAVDTRPAKKTFDDGTNTHVCLQSEDWWADQFEEARRRTGSSAYLHLIIDDHPHGTV